MRKYFPVVLASVALTTTFHVASNAAEVPSAVERQVCTQRGEYVVFAQHPLFWRAWYIPGARNPLSNATNTELSHEHIFFCKDGFVTDNVGFGPTGRFNYSQLAVRANTKIDGGRINDFRPIDNRRYDSSVIRSVLLGSVVLLDSCKLDDSTLTNNQGFDNGIYGGVVNNCQGWAARVREFYWKRIFVGTWEAQLSGNQAHMQVTWNSASNRYEGVLTKQGQGSQYVGFSIGELSWTATLVDNSSRMNERQKWRTGRDGVSTGSEWRDGIVDLDRSTVDNLVTSTANFRRVK